ncbi:hypothetical protein GCM10011328_17440 [Hafnia psychrotolerans]|uniref:Transposase n=1 Tax=Hafnia psychrotolerans TaxID=1477018 RepID=A0ABQ1GG58_9GAMM|nr:hypothetical protein GCM10011328_17440 [Hafnia psychrotolerans]
MTKSKASSLGRPQQYSKLAISTVLMLKRVVFRLTLRSDDVQPGEAMAMIRACVPESVRIV